MKKINLFCVPTPSFLFCLRMADAERELSALSLQRIYEGFDADAMMMMIEITLGM